MAPLLDRDFVAYLNFAVDRERAAVAASGLDPDREPTPWLQVLGLVKQGCYAELAKALRADIQAVSYCLRMPDAEGQRLLLEQTVATLPTWDVRQFSRVASNIAANVGLRAKAGTVNPALAERCAQLGRDVAELLPPAKVDLLSRPADEVRGTLPGLPGQRSGGALARELAEARMGEAPGFAGLAPSSGSSGIGSFNVLSDTHDEPAEEERRGAGLFPGF